MITCQCAEAIPTYASQSSYLTPIPSANIERGVIPLDSLPADWWNWLWNNITLNEARIVQFINSVFSEINSVLSAAGVTPSTASTTDLKTAIQKLATTVATSAVPGSVLSSTLSGKLRVIADGTASINGLGTPDQLETTSKEVVSAINEVLALAQGKAPTSHASSDTTYGVGTTQQYGHVKVTEGCGLAISNGTISLNAPGYNCTGTVTAVCFNGTKYTPSSGIVSFNASGANCTGTVTAVCFNGTKYTPSSGIVNLGNSPSGFPGYGTAICALNGNLCCASSAGTSNLVARADHVHKMPACLCYGGNYIAVSSYGVFLDSRWDPNAGAGSPSIGMHSCRVEHSMEGSDGYSLPTLYTCMAGTTGYITHTLRPTQDSKVMHACVSDGSNGCAVHQAYVPFQCTSLAGVFNRLGIGCGRLVLSGGFRVGNKAVASLCRESTNSISLLQFTGSSCNCGSICTFNPNTTCCLGGVLIW